MKKQALPPQSPTKVHRPAQKQTENGRSQPTTPLSETAVLQMQQLMGNGFVQRQLLRHNGNGRTKMIQRSGDDEADTSSDTSDHTDLDLRDYAFIFTGGSYGEAAESFIRTYYPEHHLIRAHSFEEMFDRLYHDVTEATAHNQRLHVSELVIVTHANSHGGMKIPLTRGDQQRSRFFTPWDLAELQQEFRDGTHRRFRQHRQEVVHQAITDRTQVVVRGCELGQSDEAMTALRSFFGGQATVSAPRGFQGYEVLRLEQVADLVPGDGNPYVEAFDFLAQQDFMPHDMVGVPDDQKEAYMRSFIQEHGGIPAEFFVMGQEAHDDLQSRISAGTGRSVAAEPLKHRETSDMAQDTAVPFYTPPLNGLTQATVVRWRRHDGEHIDRGQIILEVAESETADQTITVLAPYEGRLENLQVTQGDTITGRQGTVNGTQLGDIRMDFWATSAPSPLGVDPEMDHMTREEIEAEARQLNNPYRPQHAARLRRLQAAWERLTIDDVLDDTSGDPLAGLPPTSLFGDSNITAMDAARYPETPYIDTFEQGELLTPETPAAETQQQAGEFTEPDAATEPRPAAAGVPPATPPVVHQPTEAERRAAGDFSKRRREPEPEVVEPEPAAPEPTPDDQTVTLPETRELSESERMLVDAALYGAALMPGIGSMAMMIQSARQTARLLGVTVAIGPAVSATAVLGGSGGGGLYFGPNGEIGAYGSVGGRAGVSIGLSATVQMTIVRGGPSNLSGSAVAIGGGGGEVLVGGVAVLLTPDREFLGVSGSVGVGAGITVIEAYMEAQETWTTDPAVIAPPALP